MPVPIASVGIPASVKGFPLPPGVVAIGAATVRVGPGALPVATVGSLVTYHGNPNNPKAPGFNPKCAAATIAKGIPNILVEGRPVAMLGAPCTCGQHFVTEGIPNVYVGP
jgi:uncharacterized Zn-binding protein involved in type VI secretion